MNIVLFDDPRIRANLLPFTYTRPVAQIRVGIRTLEEKWKSYFEDIPLFFQTESYLQEKYPPSASNDLLFINSAICPDEVLIKAVQKLTPGQQLKKGELVIASRENEATHSTSNEYPHEITVIDQLWKIFQHNGSEIRKDFKLITANRESMPLTDKHTIVYGKENIFIEEHVDIKAAVINAENGPVYLGKGSVVQEGALIRGAFSLGEGSHINMGAKIRGDVSIGPYSKVGGEVSASVIMGYSNKAHDGFMGCSVIGEWCNIGADSNTSNLKNSYAPVKIWSHTQHQFIDTGTQFCGLMMGDHCKSGINTMFNTGTVVDVSCNIFGGSFPKNYIPSFSWGGSGGLSTFKFEKAMEVAWQAMKRRNMELSVTEEGILKHVYNLTEKLRK